MLRTNTIPAVWRDVTSVSLSRTMASCSASVTLKNVFSEAVRAVQPTTLLSKQIKLTERHLEIQGRTIDLPDSCYAVGFGKAVLGMAVALERVLGNRLQRAIVTVPKGIFETYPQLKGATERTAVIEGAENNLPDQAALSGAEEIRKLVGRLKTTDDLLFVLISGGGSALLPSPRCPVTLQEKQDLIKRLSKAGATIKELNTVRKQLSTLKGGGLARLAHPARVIALILSDIVGDPIELIASGPTVYSDDKTDDAIEILRRYRLYDAAPASVRKVLESDDSRRPPDKPFDPERVANFVIGSNRIAIDAAESATLQLGWQCVVGSRKVEEDVDRLAEFYALLASHILNGRLIKIRQLLEDANFELEENAIERVLALSAVGKILLIFGGEPTVSVSGSGTGGRNQQLALAFALRFASATTTDDRRNCGRVSLLSAGTDGVDGSTDAAGAVGDSDLAASCVENGIDASRYLDDNDSYSFFKRFQDGRFLVRTGHTGTNVMDLHLLHIEPGTGTTSRDAAP